MSINANHGPTRERPRRILLIDDDPGVLFFLGRLFEKAADVKVDTAADGPSAVRIVEKTPPDYYDMVLSDIEMPEMNGFETIRAIKELRPRMRVAMISGARIDSYLHEAFEGRIYNIITKEDPPPEIIRTFRQLLTGENIFGLENHLNQGVQIYSHRLRNYTQTTEIIQQVCTRSAVMLPSQKADTLQVGLMELITNAFYHAYGYPRESSPSLKDDEIVYLKFGSDPQRFGVSVIDESGKLKREQALEALARWVNPDDKDFFRTDGRGFLILRAMSDQLIVNIEPGVRTEVVIVNFANREYKTSKPLLIREL